MSSNCCCTTHRSSSAAPAAVVAPAATNSKLCTSLWRSRHNTLCTHCTLHAHAHSTHLREQCLQRHFSETFAHTAHATAEHSTHQTNRNFTRRKCADFPSSPARARRRKRRDSCAGNKLKLVAVRDSQACARLVAAAATSRCTRCSRLLLVRACERQTAHNISCIVLSPPSQNYTPHKLSLCLVVSYRVRATCNVKVHNKVEYSPPSSSPLCATHK